MFGDCTKLTSLDVNNFNTSNVTDMSMMFLRCYGLTSLDLSNFDASNVTNMGAMFSDCTGLTKITCKQSFKEWCWTNQTAINLPDAMREGGSGTWVIVP